jgi:tripartite-type tricarboxylate transporter receptor subunit TctC
VKPLAKTLLAAVAALLVTAAHAQDFPKHPITMIVPFAAGGTSDVIARAVAEEMGQSLGQPIVIENVAGAGGSTALARAARAEPDGYTIAIGNAGTSAATYAIYPKLPFTPESFAPIAMVAKTFGIVALRKDFPAKSLEDFIAYAKSNPGKINLGHAGIGSSNFLICKSFVQAAGIDVTLVGYRGAAPALTDAIGGQIDGVCDAAASVSQAINDKLVRGVVVGSTVRLASLPDLPTSAEASLPEFEAQGWERPVRAEGHAAGNYHQTEHCCSHRRGKRCGQKALCGFVDGRPRRRRAYAGGARAIGDARRREIPQAPGREQIGAPVHLSEDGPDLASLNRARSRR